MPKHNIASVFTIYAARVSNRTIVSLAPIPNANAFGASASPWVSATRMLGSLIPCVAARLSTSAGFVAAALVDNGHAGSDSETPTFEVTQSEEVRYDYPAAPAVAPSAPLPRSACPGRFCKVSRSSTMRWFSLPANGLVPFS